MNKLYRNLIAAAALIATLPAFAGPDWQVIEYARKNHRAADAQSGTMQAALPLDHGPRAQSTPCLNEKRQRADQPELRASKESSGMRP